MLKLDATKVSVSMQRLRVFRIVPQLQRPRAAVDLSSN
jgi:hypothetical protein